MDRTDTLVALCFAAIAAATAGMFFDLWYAVYYAIPVLVTLFMLMGSLNQRDRWSPAVVAVLLAFGGALTLLFVLAHVTLRGDGLVGGLPTSTAVFVYAVWPITTVVGPLLFTWVYHRWLRHDFQDEETQAEEVGSTAG